MVQDGAVVGSISARGSFSSVSMEHPKKTENYTNTLPVNSPFVTPLIVNKYFRGQRQRHSCGALVARQWALTYNLRLVVEGLHQFSL